MVDKAVRDCQSVSQRHTTNGDDENRVYDGFRTTPLDFSKLVKIQLPTATHYQIPTKLASVSTTIPVYAQRRKNELPGLAHPGSSVDTRFGVVGKPQGEAFQEQIRRETDRERTAGVWERDEQEGSSNQRNALVAQRGNRQTRRGHRGPRDTSSADEHQQRELSSNGGTGRTHNNSRPSQLRTSTSNHNQRILQTNNHQKLQFRVKDHYHNQSRFQEHRMDPQTRSLSFSNAQYGEEFLLLSPELPPMGHIDYTGVPFEEYPNHMRNQIMANAREAGLEGHFLNHIPDGYRSNSSDTAWRSEVLNEYYRQGLDRFYSSEDEYMEVYFRQQRDRFNQAQAEARQAQTEARRAQADARRAQESMQDRVASYTQPHHPTVQQGNRELASYADELNRQQPHPDVCRLRGDNFVGAPTLQVTAPESNVLGALAEQRDVLYRSQNEQSIGSRSIPTGTSSQQSSLSNYPALKPDLNRSTESSESGAISDDSNIQRGRRRRPTTTARTRAADERRAGSGGHYISEPRPTLQMNPAVLGPGIFSREPSPMPPRSGRFFVEHSRQSSPGAGRLNARGRGQAKNERSASAGNCH
jgi:hypothetical protein